MVKISREDLVGKTNLEEVKIIGMKETNKDEISILSIESDGKALSIGVVGDNVLDCVLEHSDKKKNGNFIQIPTKALTEAKENKIGWINKKY